MSENLITVSPLLSTQELALLFEARRISGAPVVDDDGTILGVVTKSDLTRAQAEAVPCEGDQWSWFQHPADAGAAPGTAKAAGEGLCKSHGPTPGDSPAKDISVRDVMSPTVYSIEADKPVREVAREMLSHRVHRLLVTKNGRLTGIVTATDLVRVLAET
jgi:CBS domain-containing protein